MLLNERVALITGGGSGIGRATAALFAQHGAKVVVADINSASGQETVDSIKGAGGEAHFVQGDVAKFAAVEAMVRTGIETYGRLDIVHSNAATYAMGTATELSEQEWDLTLDASLKATWMLARCALPQMLAQGAGVFVITGSVHALRGYPFYTAYQAAKGGLLALTRALAADYAPHIRVNTILPGAVVTGLWDPISEEDREKIAQMCALKRNGTPEEVAQAALFLASDMSSYMTGSHVVVDGGLSSIMMLPDDISL